MFDRVDRALGALCLGLAWLGGGALLTAALLTVASIAGRALVPLGLGPVPGDYELLQFAAAFAVAASLPLCQHRRGHVTVDLATDAMGPGAARLARAAGDLCMAAVAALVAWRTGLGLADKLGSAFYVETTFILQIPVWHGYAAALPGLILFAPVCLWTALRGLRA
jgi:TRAP-type C4-dicarboxylate transport system permease small subunit